jgi:energy-coupling factor transport system permease protein
MNFQTIERDSPFTRMDFRPKLLLLLAITGVAFVWESPLLLGTMAAVLLVTCLLTGVSARYIRLVLQIMAPFYVLLLVTHGFFNVEHVKSLLGGRALTPLFVIPKRLWLIGGGVLSREGLSYALSVILKTVAITLVVPLVIFTTDIERMIVGMVRARIPYKLAFIFAATLRFFPLLLADIGAIIDAQKMRGLAIDKMGPVRRVRVYARVAVPLILGAMVKSQQLEVVLQAKAFSGSADRTYLHEVRLSAADYLTFAIAGGFLLSAIVLYLTLGIGKFTVL